MALKVKWIKCGKIKEVWWETITLSLDDDGDKVDESVIADKVMELGDRNGIKSLVILGSEPLDQIEPLMSLCYRLKEEGWKIALKTSYSWREISSVIDNDVKKTVLGKVLVLNYINYIIDTSSKIESIIDVRKSLESRKVIYFKKSFLDKLFERGK